MCGSYSSTLKHETYHDFTSVTNGGTVRNTRVAVMLALSSRVISEVTITTSSDVTCSDKVDIMANLGFCVRKVWSLYYVLFQLQCKGHLLPQTPTRSLLGDKWPWLFAPSGDLFSHRSYAAASHDYTNLNQFIHIYICVCVCGQYSICHIYAICNTLRGTFLTSF